MTLLQLDQVTLCCVETRHLDLARRALERTVSQARFARAVLFTTPVGVKELGQPVPGLELHPIGNIGSLGEYSRFVLHSLPELIGTDFALVVQWDGFVLDPGAWEPAFLDVDYVGAVWPWRPPGRRVGNGGFSLRSRRLMQEVRRLAPAIDAPEDMIICDRLAPALAAGGIRFAPDDLARRFSFELEPPRARTFGFHGLPNFPLVFDAATLDERVAGLPSALVGSVEAQELARRLLERGRLAAARSLVRKRVELGLDDADTTELKLKCWRRTEPCFCGSGQVFRNCHGRLR